MANGINRDQIVESVLKSRPDLAQRLKEARKTRAGDVVSAFGNIFSQKGDPRATFAQAKERRAGEVKEQFAGEEADRKRQLENEQRDPNSRSNQLARKVFRATFPEATKRLEAEGRFEQLTNDQLEKQFPQLQKILDREDKKAAREFESKSAKELLTQRQKGDIELERERQKGRLAEAQIKTTEKPKIQSVGQKQLDKEFAKDLNKFQTVGRNQAISDISNLNDAISVLENGANVTGPIIGRIPGQTFFNPKGVQVQEAVARVVQKTLRETLGGQFSEREGENLVKRSFNPALGEEENARRARRLLLVTQQMLQAKDKAAEFFRNNRGTLEGFVPPQFSIEELEFAITGQRPQDVPRPGDAVEIKGPDGLTPSERQAKIDANNARIQELKAKQGK